MYIWNDHKEDDDGCDFLFPQELRKSLTNGWCRTGNATLTVFSVSSTSASCQTGPLRSRSTSSLSPSLSSSTSSLSTSSWSAFIPQSLKDKFLKKSDIDNQLNLISFLKSESDPQLKLVNFWKKVKGTPTWVLTRFSSLTSSSSPPSPQLQIFLSPPSTLSSSSSSPGGDNSSDPEQPDALKEAGGAGDNQGWRGQRYLHEGGREIGTIMTMVLMMMTMGIPMRLRDWYDDDNNKSYSVEPFKEYHHQQIMITVNMLIICRWTGRSSRGWYQLWRQAPMKTSMWTRHSSLVCFLWWSWWSWWQWWW